MKFLVQRKHRKPSVAKNEAAHVNEQVIREKGMTGTFPCILLVSLITCVTELLEFAGRLPLVAGSRCSCVNCRERTSVSHYNVGK